MHDRSGMFAAGLTDNREEIFADSAVQGKCAAAETEEGEPGGPDHQGKLQIKENRGCFADGE